MVYYTDTETNQPETKKMNKETENALSAINTNIASNYELACKIAKETGDAKGTISLVNIMADQLNVVHHMMQMIRKESTEG